MMSHLGPSQPPTDRQLSSIMSYPHSHTPAADSSTARSTTPGTLQAQQAITHLPCCHNQAAGLRAATAADSCPPLSRVRPAALPSQAAAACASSSTRMQLDTSSSSSSSSQRHRAQLTTMWPMVTHMPACILLIPPHQQADWLQQQQTCERKGWDQAIWAPNESTMSLMDSTAPTVRPVHKLQACPWVITCSRQPTAPLGLGSRLIQRPPSHMGPGALAPIVRRLRGMGGSLPSPSPKLHINRPTHFLATGGISSLPAPLLMHLP